MDLLSSNIKSKKSHKQYKDVPFVLLGMVKKNIAFKLMKEQLFHKKID